MTYRQATMIDIDRIMVVNQHNLHEHYAYEHWYGLIMTPENKGLSFVCLDPNNKKRVLGYIVGNFTGEETQLYSLAVAEKSRGQGIGRKLLQLFLEAAKKREVPITLHVRVSNRKAIEMYERAGFKVKETEKEYYPEPLPKEDAHVMVLQI